MSAEEQPASGISELMTWEEICERFPNSWVSVVEIQRNIPRGGAIRSGRVVRSEPFCARLDERLSERRILTERSAG